MKIIGINKNLEKVEFKSAYEAAKYIETSAGNVYRQIEGHLKQIKGWKFTVKKDKLNVYLAGKISRCDWRQELVDIRNNFAGNEKWKIRNGYYLSYPKFNVDIVGPFFLACDHSCYHGNNSHGVGLGKDDCYGLDDTFSEKEVYDICIQQIKKSDVIFAYIDDKSCYGTLFELGYAASLGKDIIILYDYDFPAKDMWFINKSAKIVVYKTRKDTSVKDMFDKIMESYK